MEKIDAYEDWLVFKGIDFQEGIDNVGNYVTAYAQRWQDFDYHDWLASIDYDLVASKHLHTTITGKWVVNDKSE